MSDTGGNRKKIEEAKDSNIFIEVFNDFEEELLKSKKNSELPLSGVTMAIKDNILIKGKKCSAGSKILENYVAPYDATVIEKLRNAGAVFVGRTNMDEFAMGSSTESSAYGATKNPYAEDRAPGGSSGGSAAAVSAGFVDAALGSDTGGSIRQPASFCGVVGLKPTYGSVSRFGLIAMASSLDQIGPLTKTVEFSEKIFSIIKGKDPKDSTSVNYVDGGSSLKKIGYPKELLENGVDKDVLENFKESLKKCEGLGYKIIPLDMPDLLYSLPVYYIIMPAEASSNLARFDSIKYGLKKDGGSLLDRYLETRGDGFGREVRRRILLGTYVLSSGYYDAYYKKATVVRKIISNTYREAFKRCDVIAMPTSPTPAFKIGERIDNPLKMYLSDIFTVSANLAGIPAMSIPSGFAERDGKKLPLGFQLSAPHFCEVRLFELGKIFERKI